MATGVGIDAVQQGSEWVGRSALDDRLIVRSEFHNLGVVMGCDVKTSSSALTYSVSPGNDPVSVAVASRGGADGATKFIVPSGSVTTAPGPSSGARIDIIWARQNDPSKGDPNNLAVLGITQGAASADPRPPSIPAGAVELAQYRVPQGATRTNQATLLWHGALAIPYGASLGIIHAASDSSNAPYPQVVTGGAGSFTLPTSRTVEFRLTPTVMASVPNQSGLTYYRITVDGRHQVSFPLAYAGPTSSSFTWTTTLGEGRHTVSYSHRRASGPAYRGLYGPWEGEQYQGTKFFVVDLGVATE